MPIRKLATRTIAAAVLLSLGACLGSEEPESHWVGTAPVAEENAPLAGAALEQRRERMVRAQRDLADVQTTLESLYYRDDRDGLRRMARFADAYLSMHVDPLLAHEWQSRHPEVAVVDANLRLAKADVLLRMDQNDRAGQVLDELERRFARRSDMLVEYPLGTQRHLGEALKLLRDRT
jgi:hypothetical protein